ncbi:MAG: site-specific integrase [Alphaproteobacteria bacterium]|nr:site-specific integrase [Alphaproteobacteria bacterium]
MTKALTKRDVEGLEPRDKPYVVWDPGLKGFGVRVSSNDAKTFVVKVRVGRGRFAEQRWITVGRYGPLTLDKARAEARLVIARAMTGNEPSSRPKVTELEVMTVEDLCRKWLETGALRSRALGRRFGELRDPANVNVDRGRVHAHIIPLIGKVKLQELHRRHITFLRDQIAKGATSKREKTKPRGKRVVRGGDGTATRTVRLVSSILSFAVREGYLGINPAIGVETTPDKARERFLSDDEAIRLGKAISAAEAEGAHPFAIAIIRLLAMCGARRSEIEKLKWSDVDFGTGYLRIAKGKTGSRLIPLTSQMRTIFEAVPQMDGTEFVFPARTLTGPFQGLPKVWNDVRAKAKLPDLRLHDLRHSAASFALAQGVPLEVIGRLLGHTDLKTTRRYAHLADSIARQAAERTAGVVAGLLMKAPSDS